MKSTKNKKVVKKSKLSKTRNKYKINTRKKTKRKTVSSKHRKRKSSNGYVS